MLERLYPLVEKHHEVGERAGKVTGMLLELDTPDVLHLIEFPDALHAKVVEAINVLAHDSLSHG